MRIFIKLFWLLDSESSKLKGDSGASGRLFTKSQLNGFQSTRWSGQVITPWAIAWKARETGCKWDCSELRFFGLQSLVGKWADLSGKHIEPCKQWLQPLGRGHSFHFESRRTSSWSSVFWFFSSLNHVFINDHQHYHPKICTNYVQIICKLCADYVQIISIVLLLLK